MAMPAEKAPISLQDIRCSEDAGLRSALKTGCCAFRSCGGCFDDPCVAGARRVVTPSATAALLHPSETARWDGRQDAVAAGAA